MTYSFCGLGVFLSDPTRPESTVIPIIATYTNKVYGNRKIKINAKEHTNDKLNI